MADQYDNLEEFREPELYDREYGAYEPEGPFYESLARDLGGPILDIACGTGRLAIPFAEAGLSVTGTDIMPAMLAHARAKSAHLPIRWVEADSRSLDLGETFAFAVMSGHAFQSFLTDDDQAGLFRSVHAHLRPGGLFAFETRNKRPADLAVDGKEGFWHSFVDGDGRTVDVSLIETWHPETELLDCRTIRRWRDGSRADQRKRIRIRYSDAPTLKAKLEQAGFTVEAQYGDWDCSPVSTDSPEIITLARRNNRQCP